MSKEKKEHRLLKFSNVNQQLSFMKGKLLTLIDASISGEKQNKATKDIVHQIVGSTVNLFWRHVIGEEVFPEKETTK